MRGDVEGAAELLAAASEAVGPGDAVIDRVWVMRAAIVLGRVGGNIDRVRSAVDEALGISADTAHDAPLWWLLCAALAAEADEADRATRRRDADGVATAQARGLRLARILDEAASALGSDDGRWPPTLRAYVRHGAADRLRLAGQSDISAWMAAIEAYDDLGYIYEAASCRLHLAETVLAAGGAREEAAAALRAAADTAARLRAEPLLAAVAGLAGRARIDLGTETGGGDDLGVGLTAREQEVLGLLAGGLTNREIGEALFISEKTASVHVSNILGKLGVGGRGAAVAMALRLGFEPGRRGFPRGGIGGAGQPGGRPHVATCLPDDPDEVAQVVERPDVRRRSVDRPDRDPRDRAAQADARRDHLDLELEPALVAAERRLHDPPPDQPVAGLVVGDRPADGPRERPAAELVREPARRRHRPEVAPADDEVRSRVGLEGGHELRDLGRVVLAVGVERQDRVVALGDGAFEAKPQRRALALVRALFDDRRPRGACLFGRVVRRAVVDDEDRQVARASPRRPARSADPRCSPGSARRGGLARGRVYGPWTCGQRPRLIARALSADPDQEDG